MRSLFAPKLPVSLEERQWLDDSLAWLRQEFGEAPLAASRPVVLPTNDFFPDNYDGTEATLYPLFRRVCGYMEVDPANVRLVVKGLSTGAPSRCGDGAPVTTRNRGAAGYYRHAVEPDQLPEIAIRGACLPNPLVTIAVLAHELGHVRLLGEERLQHDEPDHEPLTDLLTVYMGLGIFNANAAFQFRQYSDGQRGGGWSVQRLGYLPETMFGYALARFAEMRGERNPAWQKHLSTNARAYFQRSARYLEHEQPRRSKGAA